MSVPEVMNRATITGAIEIGRHPGVVQVTFRAPVERLAPRGLLPLRRGAVRVRLSASGVMARMSAVALHDDGWAIRALPPGRRDLGCFELWDRSLERSRRRRALAARSTGLPVRAVSAALLTAAVVVPGPSLRSRRTRPRPPPAPPTRRHRPGRGGRAAGARDLRRRRVRPADRAAVIAFQSAHGLEVDGVIGPMTRAALGGGAGAAAGGSVTAALQQMLGIAADGEYGPITRAAVRSYQAAHGLLVDGVAGPQTLGSLGLPTTSRSVRRWRRRSAACDRCHARAARQAVRVGGERPVLVRLLRADGLGVPSAGVALPRTTYGQVGMGVGVDRAASSRATSSSSTPTARARRTSASPRARRRSSPPRRRAASSSTRAPAAYWGERYVRARRVG